MISCAAIKVGQMVVSMAAPARHHDIIRAYYVETGQRIGSDGTQGGTVQGFLTDDGRFVDRETAYGLTGKGRGGKTFSEDLW